MPKPLSPLIEQEKEARKAVEWARAEASVSIKAAQRKLNMLRNAMPYKLRQDVNKALAQFVSDYEHVKNSDQFDFVKTTLIDNLEALGLGRNVILHLAEAASEREFSKSRRAILRTDKGKSYALFYYQQNMLHQDSLKEADEKLEAVLKGLSDIQARHARNITEDIVPHVQTYFVQDAVDYDDAMQGVTRYVEDVVNDKLGQLDDKTRANITAAITNIAAITIQLGRIGNTPPPPQPDGPKRGA